jgi:hypothetical protein
VPVVESSQDYADALREPKALGGRERWLDLIVADTQAGKPGRPTRLGGSCAVALYGREGTP